MRILLRLLVVVTLTATLGQSPSLLAQQGDSPPAAAGESQVPLRLSIEDAVRIALSNNFQIRAADVERDIRYHVTIVERSVFDPFLTLGGNFSKNRRPTSSFLDVGALGLSPVVQVNPTEARTYSAGVEGRTLIGTTYSMTFSGTRFDRPLATGSIFGFNPQEDVNAGIEVTQPLLRGAWYGYNSARIRIAVNNEVLARAQLDASISELIYRVESAYWELSFAKKNLESKTKSLATAQANFEKTRDENEAGTSSDLDLATVESQLAIRKVEKSEARALAHDARDRLLLLINRTGMNSLRQLWRRGEKDTAFGQLDIVPTTEPQSNIEVPARDPSLEIAFRQRADYRQLDTRMENKLIELEIARNELLPQLDVALGWTQHGLAGDTEAASDSLLTRDFYSWSAGLQFRIPLRLRGPRSSSARVRNELLQMKFQEADLENLIVVEVDKAIRDLKMLHQRKKDIDDRVRLQAEILEKEREKLVLGRTILYNVGVIENDLVDSQAQALRVAADYQVSLSEYLRATGQLLTVRGVELDDGS